MLLTHAPVLSHRIPTLVGNIQYQTAANGAGTLTQP